MVPMDAAARAEQREAAALAEIEWCCELMIAAAAVRADRLAPDVIDEVLGVRRAAGRPAARDEPAARSLLAS